MKKRLAIFSSGSGSTAESIMEAFQNHSMIKVEVLVTNKADAGVVLRARKFGVEVACFSNVDFEDGLKVARFLQSKSIDLIVLAGFLRLIPTSILNEYENRIINIHPSLLPDFGGKGMYGRRVHEAVIQSGATESGFSVHLVNKEFDKGKIIFRHPIRLNPGETSQSLEERVKELERIHYPKVISSYLSGEIYP